MNKRLLVIAFAAILLIFTGCKKDDDKPDEWFSGSAFGGSPRSGSASFTINGIIYVFGGYNYSKKEYLKDMWYYDSTKDNWFKVLNEEFPGKARNYAVGFSIKGKGYIGTGFDGTEPLSDFYEFDPTAAEGKKWKAVVQKFPGEARRGATAFDQNDKGFVCFGATVDDGNLKDLYSYDPASGWTTLNGLPGTKRVNAFTFKIGNINYVGGGKDNALYLADFWKYEANGDKWTRLEDINRDKDGYKYYLARESAATFVIGGQGYIACGSNGGTLGSTYSYNPDTDSWKEHQSFKGSARDATIGFSINGRGYVVTGKNGSQNFDDMWTFTPVW